MQQTSAVHFQFFKVMFRSNSADKKAFLLRLILPSVAAKPTDNRQPIKKRDRSIGNDPGKTFFSQRQTDNIIRQPVFRICPAMLSLPWGQTAYRWNGAN